MTERCELTPFMMKTCVAVVLLCINSQALIYKLVDSMAGVIFLLIVRPAGLNFEGFGYLWVSILNSWDAFGPPF